MLGVAPGSSNDEVTKAYRQLAKKYHPDLNPGDKEAEKKMAEINAAYDSIINGTPYGPRARAGSPYGGSTAGGGTYAGNPFGGSGGQQGGWYYGPMGGGQQGGQGQYYDPFADMFRAWQEATQSEEYREAYEERQRQQREQRRSTANGCITWIIIMLVFNMALQIFSGGCSTMRGLLFPSTGSSTNNQQNEQADPLNAGGDSSESSESEDAATSDDASQTPKPAPKPPFKYTTTTSTVSYAVTTTLD